MFTTYRTQRVFQNRAFHSALNRQEKNEGAATTHLVTT